MSHCVYCTTTDFQSLRSRFAYITSQKLLELPSIFLVCVLCFQSVTEILNYFIITFTPSAIIPCSSSGCPSACPTAFHHLT